LTNPLADLIPVPEWNSLQTRIKNFRDLESLFAFGNEKNSLERLQEKGHKKPGIPTVFFETVKA